MAFARRLSVPVALCAAFLAGAMKGDTVMPVRADVSLITDRSASSAACGTSAVKWGFMCPLVARHGENLYSINFTRTPDTEWNTLKPIEAPVALWAGKPGGPWRSVLLDGPKRTYQTPVLLMDPQGRAHVFTLHPGDGTVCWYHPESAENKEFH